MKLPKRIKVSCIHGTGAGSNGKFWVNNPKKIKWYKNLIDKGKLELCKIIKEEF